MASVWSFHKRAAPLRFEIHTKAFTQENFTVVAMFSEIGDAAAYAVAAAYRAGCTQVHIVDTTDHTTYTVEWTAHMLPHVVQRADEETHE